MNMPGVTIKYPTTLLIQLTFYLLNALIRFKPACSSNNEPTQYQLITWKFK